MRILAIMLCLSITVEAQSQSVFESSILGTWKSTKVDNSTILFFQDNGTIDVDMGGGDQYKAKYRFKSDSVLFLGTTVYNILELDSERLVTETAGWIKTKDEYKRVDVKVEPIKEKEFISEKWPNGNKKTEGDKRNGFMHGKWVSWFENGELESTQNFFNGIPAGKQEFWYKNGQKKEEKEIVMGKLIYLYRWDETGKLTQEIDNRK